MGIERGSTTRDALGDPIWISDASNGRIASYRHVFNPCYVPIHPFSRSAPQSSPFSYGLTEVLRGVHHHGQFQPSPIDRQSHP